MNNKSDIGTLFKSELDWHYIVGESAINPNKCLTYNFTFDTYMEVDWPTHIYPTYPLVEWDYWFQNDVPDEIKKRIAHKIVKMIC